MDKTRDDITAHIRIHKLKEQSDFSSLDLGKGRNPMPQTIRNGQTQFSFAFHVAAELHEVPRSS